MHEWEERNSLNALRGITCFLVVIYHAIGETPASGLRIADDTFWARFVDLLAYVRMPLFAFLAGYAYGKRPAPFYRRIFLRKKARRLLLPVFTVGTIAALAQAFVPGTNAPFSSFETLHIMPVAQFWFLESLFWIFAGIMVLEKLRLLDNPWTTTVIAVIAAIVQLVNPFHLPWFSIQGAIYLLPYFMVGLIAARHRPLEEFPALGPSCTLVTVLGFPLLALSVYDLLPDVNRISFLALVFGVTSTLAATQFNWSNPVLEWIGKYSYGIFLFHVMFTAGTRIAANSVGITDIGTLIALTTLAGVLGPIPIEMKLRQWRLTNVLILGASWNANDEEKPARVPADIK
jgi:peptidoglycan/LPS O-acetylase OafA/YrhL